MLAHIDFSEIKWSYVTHVRKISENDLKLLNYRYLCNVHTVCSIACVCTFILFQNKKFRPQHSKEFDSKQQSLFGCTNPIYSWVYSWLLRSEKVRFILTPREHIDMQFQNFVQKLSFVKLATLNQNDSKKELTETKRMTPKII